MGAQHTQDSDLRVSHMVCVGVVVCVTLVTLGGWVGCLVVCVSFACLFVWL